MGSQKRALRASPPGRSGRAPAASRDSGSSRVRAARILPPAQSSPSRVSSEHNAFAASSEHQNPQLPSSTADFANGSVLILDDEAGQGEPIDAMLSDWFSMPGAALSPLYSADHQTAALPESANPHSEEAAAPEDPRE
ncbi:uncharacterized protein ACLA_076290 [Aspergillus clavatus NRRL 1]|uniref:Uncharacterized protein n=1 Tax=Aspergillus clavatus (strain ATCC 1007 / CBS 513.65 / DSM 816 / NCTC 3887 / NRRL 1 / QM 1276 / 107) TaxID=344612 RepID=A1C868_ASPCL|nr:uncharacterized protein ACLA_076290 [Aspergillus clavatus NRRL 1]EAW14589.1 hypothetical protein ACLA_076290 [Aspergillus clavatus NRRL 1]